MGRKPEIFAKIEIPRLCRRCKIQKDLSEFEEARECKNGRRSTCRECQRQQRNKEVINARRRQAWAQKNKDRTNIIRKQTAAERLSHLREYFKKKRVSGWKRPVTEKDRMRQRAWNKRNPDKMRAYKAGKRARKAFAAGRVTAAEWRAIKLFYDNTCLNCLRKEPAINLTMDHVIPLIKGGLHAASNIQPLCLSCNDKKATKTIDYRLGAELMSYWSSLEPTIGAQNG